MQPPPTTPHPYPHQKSSEPFHSHSFSWGHWKMLILAKTNIFPIFLGFKFIMKPSMFIALWFMDIVISSPIDIVSTNSSNVCSSNDCYKTAYTLLSNMNTFVDPCEDFYEVQHWIKLLLSMDNFTPRPFTMFCSTLRIEPHFYQFQPKLIHPAQSWKIA